MRDTIERSRKSRMKKRSDEWEAIKTEIAQELGLWDTVQSFGWSGLSAADSGRLGGVLAARKKALTEQRIEELRDYVEEHPEPTNRCTAETAATAKTALTVDVESDGDAQDAE